MKVLLKLAFGLLHYGLILVTGFMFLLVVLDYLIPVVTLGIFPNLIDGVNWYLVTAVAAGGLFVKMITAPLFHGIQFPPMITSDTETIFDPFDDIDFRSPPELNPATGLEMHGGVDAAGNCFGEDDNWK